MLLLGAKKCGTSILGQGGLNRLISREQVNRPTWLNNR
jgi:hypothetical protein